MHTDVYNIELMLYETKRPPIFTLLQTRTCICTKPLFSSLHVHGCHWGLCESEWKRERTGILWRTEAEGGRQMQAEREFYFHGNQAVLRLPCLLSSSYILTEARITRAALLFAHVVYGTLPCRIGVCGIVDVCGWVFRMVLWRLNMFILERFSEWSMWMCSYRMDEILCKDSSPSRDVWDTAHNPSDVSLDGVSVVLTLALKGLWK